MGSGRMSILPVSIWGRTPFGCRWTQSLIFGQRGKLCKWQVTSCSTKLGWFTATMLTTLWITFSMIKLSLSEELCKKSRLFTKILFTQMLSLDSTQSMALFTGSQLGKTVSTQPNTMKLSRTTKLLTFIWMKRKCCQLWVQAQSSVKSAQCLKFQLLKTPRTSIQAITSRKTTCKNSDSSSFNFNGDKRISSQTPTWWWLDSPQLTLLDPLCWPTFTFPNQNTDIG